MAPPISVSDGLLKFVAHISEVGGGYGGYNPDREFFGYRQSTWSRHRNRRPACQPAADRCGGGRTPVPNWVNPTARLTIPACIGCGSMHQDDNCPGGCSERRVELVSGSDYDQLAAAAAACRARVRGLRAVARELALADPAHGEQQAAYEALQRSARSALRRFRHLPGGRDDPLSPVRTVVVWRCPDCGGVDVRNECIDVCIWYPAQWVDAARYEQERSHALAAWEAERSLADLLGRLAFATPRAGQWERSLYALQTQARRTLPSA